MNIIFLLAPFSVLLGLMAIAAFVWTLRAGQYDDIRGAAERILIEDDDQPGDLEEPSSAEPSEKPTAT